MKSLKQILQEMTDASNKKYGTPVLISQGEHSKPKPKPSKYGTAVMVSQGEHSKPKDDVKEDFEHDLSKSQSLPSYSDDAIVKHYGGRHAPKVNSHIGANDEDVHGALHEHYTTRGMDEDHHEALRSYTEDSSILNEHLFKSHQRGDPPSRHFHDSLEHLDGALHNTNGGMPHDHLSVFSGTKFHPGKKAAQGDGKLYLPAYTSTSIRPHVAVGFAQSFKPDTEEHQSYGERTDQHVLHIKIPKGFPGHYIGEDSNHPHEREFIMPRGTQLHVHPEPTILEHRNGASPERTHLQGPSRVHIWHATAVHVGPEHE